MRRCGLHIGAGIGLDADVPTHRDHPWERDARRRGRNAGSEGHPPPSREVQTASLARARVRRPAYGGGAPAPRATWRAPIAVAIVAAIAIAAMAGLTAPEPLASLPSPSPAVGLPSTSDRSEGSVSDLQSRFIGRGALEVWGRTTAPDGSSIRIRVQAADAAPIAVSEVPAVAGRFYVNVSLPSALQGRSVNIAARLAP